MKTFQGERERTEWQREREQQREGKEKAAREREGRGTKRERNRDTERENAGTESSFFPVARDRFEHCPCKEKDSKIPFGTWMGKQGYRNKEEVYLLLIQSNLSGRLRAQ